MQEIHTANLFRRFASYQRERFPLLTHGSLIAVISIAGVNYSALARGIADQSALDNPQAAIVVAFLCAFGFFFQLRVADEFKDYADDLAHRPYRPVPRGLIRLGELAMLAVGVMAVQAVLSYWLRPQLLLLLLGVWVYMGLMRYEFFVHDWLRAHPLVYMLAHMGIMPLIFLFITGCDWLAAGAAPLPGLGWFLAMGFFNGIVFEIGRKLRAPQDEEEGVETYSRLWGQRMAVGAWLLAMVLAGLCARFAARQVHIAALVTTSVLVLLGVAIWLGQRFLQAPIPRRAKWLETFSGIWMLVVYLGLGVVPVLYR